MKGKGGTRFKKHGKGEGGSGGGDGSQSGKKVFVDDAAGWSSTTEALLALFPRLNQKP